MSYLIENLMYDISNFKKKLKIAVIYGGDKNVENSVLFKSINSRDWKSYKIVADEIANTLGELGFLNVTLIADDLNLINNLKKNKIDFAWLNTGGVQGLNPLSHTPAILEMLGIPFVGHNSINSTLLDNKHLFKYVLKNFDIETPDFLVLDLHRITSQEFVDKILLKKFKDKKFEFVVKPVSGRGSVNVFYVSTKKEFIEAVESIFSITQDLILIERYLKGREFCVAVHGEVTHRYGSLMDIKEPFAFSTIERVLDDDEKVFTSMDKRPITSTRVRSVDELELESKLENLGKKIYKAYNIETLIRVDIRADENNKLNVLEVNPKPDLKKAEKSCSSLISLGLDRYNIRYHELILQLFANTIFDLFRYKKHLVEHMKNIK
jgi:D-alanine-D-alanine ligase